MSSPLAYVLPVLAASTMGLSCISRYYVPETLKGAPRETLVEVNVTEFDWQAEILIDGVKPWPLWGGPRRRLYLEPGEHEVQIHYDASTGSSSSYTNTIDLIDTKKGTWRPMTVTTTTTTQPRAEVTYSAVVSLQAGKYEWHQIAKAVMNASTEEVVVIDPE